LDNPAVLKQIFYKKKLDEILLKFHIDTQKLLGKFYKFIIPLALGLVWIMMLNTTFNNISVIFWQFRSLLQYHKILIKKKTKKINTLLFSICFS
jgi:hypothetical protein